MVDSSKNVIVRTLCTNEEFTECVALQQHVWGEDFADCVPVSLMIVAAVTGYG